MKRSTQVARSATPTNLDLPIESPRNAWPALLDRAADHIAGLNVIGGAVLALELRTIAMKLRSEASA